VYAREGWNANVVMCAYSLLRVGLWVVVYGCTYALAYAHGEGWV
jgi:hypothetical protein